MPQSHALHASRASHVARGMAAAVITAAAAWAAGCSSSTDTTGSPTSGSDPSTPSGSSGASGSSSSGSSGASGSSSSGSSGTSSGATDGGADAKTDGGNEPCGKPGDTGNSKGVGKYCKGIVECLGNKDAQLCAVAGDPTATFCTKLCKKGDGASVCGENATCVCDPSGGGQCGCTPTSCL